MLTFGFLPLTPPSCLISGRDLHSQTVFPSHVKTKMGQWITMPTLLQLVKPAERSRPFPALCYTVELSQYLNKHSLINKVSPQSDQLLRVWERRDGGCLPGNCFTNHTSWCILVNFPIKYVIRNENLVNISPCYMSAILWRTFVPYLFLSRVMWLKLFTPIIQWQGIVNDTLMSQSRL